METGDKVEGVFVVSEGSLDFEFYVIDDWWNIILTPKYINDVHNFAFVVPTDGIYWLEFDNWDSPTSKTVVVNATRYPAFQIWAD